MNLQKQITAGQYRVLVGLGILILLISSGAFIQNVIVRRAEKHIHTFAGEIKQAVTALEAGRADPSAAVAVAQAHLTAARRELDFFRPLARPVAAQADRLALLPVIGSEVDRLAACWAFADSATAMGQQLLEATALGLDKLNANDFDGLAATVPAIEQHLQAAESSFVRAQAARERLKDLSWAPDTLSEPLNQALAQWDEKAPALGQNLKQINLLAASINVAEAWPHARTLVDELAQAAEVSENVEQNPSAAILQARQHLIAARLAYESLAPLIEPFIAQAKNFSTIPGADYPLEQLVAWRDFADAATLLGRELSIATELGYLNLEEDGMTGLVSTMPSLQNYLQAAQVSFYQAQSARAKITTANSNLPAELARPLDKTLAQWDALAGRLEKTLPNSDELFRVLPLLLGAEKPVTYLLVLQSSDELRATGGFIGGIGTLEITGGKITSTAIKEVTQYDNQPALTGQSLTHWTQPPEPLTRYMGLGHWYLRDANWWADFPASARQIAEFWQVENNTPLDGVIALTDQGVADLLANLGAATTFDGQLVSADAMKAVAADRIYQGDHTGAIDQTAFLHEMSIVLVSLTRDMSPERTIKLSQFLKRAVARHDLLIAGFDPPTAAVLYNLGVYGALKGRQDDYVYLVEDNLSYNKLSPFIQQDMNYEVQLRPDGSPSLATLTVEAMNTYTTGLGLAGYPAGYYDGGRWNSETRSVDRWEGYYGGYTRLYPPPASQFLTATGFDDAVEVQSENHRPVIGGYLGMIPGVRHRLQYQWIPNVTLSRPGQYKLLAQRQPGAPDRAFTVVACLPSGFQAADIVPAPIAADAQSVTWHAVLDQDQTFSLTLVESAVPAIPDPVPSDNAALTTGVLTAATTTISRTVAPAPVPSPGRGPVPVWLSIPRIGVEAPIMAVGLEPSGIMASPSEAGLVAWYELGPRPGEPSNAVLAGHVDWKGAIGVFARLDELQVGDVIEVQNGPDSGFQFAVESVNRYQAATAPVAEIFGSSPHSMITLITCTGPFDLLRQEYRDRLIIKAAKLD